MRQLVWVLLLCATGIVSACASPVPSETVSPSPIFAVTASITPAPPPTTPRTPTRQPTASPTSGLRTTPNVTPSLPCAAGTAWRVWRSDKDPDRITALLAEGSTLWVGTMQGLARVDMRTGAATPYIQAREMGPVKTILPLGEGRLWIHAESGCFYYNGQQWARVESVACRYANTWGIDRNGDLWARGYAETRFYSLYTAHFVGHIPPRDGIWEPDKSEVKGLPRSEEDCSAWQAFASYSWAYRSSSECQAMNRARQTFRSRVPDWHGFLAIDADGSLWDFNTMALGHLEANGTLTSIRFGTLAYALAPDPKHGVWIGTGDGLAYYDGQRVQWKSLDLGACSIPQVTHGLAVDSHSVAWVGTTSGIRTQRPENRDWRPVTDLGLQSEQANWPIAAMAADPHGGVWATDNYSLWKFGGPTARLATSLPLPGCYFENLLIDTAGSVWGAVAPCGTLRFDPATGQWTEYHFFRKNQGPMTMGSDGTLYILGRDGLYTYSRATLEWRLVVASLTATAIAADRQSGVWIGLRDMGELWHYRNGQIESLSLPFEKSLGQLFVDNRNRLWATVSGNLKVYDGQSWQPVALALGVLREITSGPDGRVWVLGSSGVAVYDPAKDK